MGRKKTKYLEVLKEKEREPQVKPIRESKLPRFKDEEGEVKTGLEMAGEKKSRTDWQSENVPESQKPSRLSLEVELECERNMKVHLRQKGIDYRLEPQPFPEAEEVREFWLWGEKTHVEDKSHGWLVVIFWDGGNWARTRIFTWDSLKEPRLIQQIRETAAKYNSKKHYKNRYDLLKKMIELLRKATEQEEKKDREKDKVYIRVPVKSR